MICLESRNIYPLSEMWVVETKWKCNTDSLKLDKLPQPRVVEEHFFYAPQEAKLHGKSLHIDAWRRLVLLHLKYACFMMLLNSVSNGQTSRDALPMKTVQCLLVCSNV